MRVQETQNQSNERFVKNAKHFVLKNNGFAIYRIQLHEKQNKQTQLEMQLQDLKNVIQARKIEERQTSLDKAYEENLAGGDNKYSTIQKARSGTALKRMAMLQDL